MGFFRRVPRHCRPLSTPPPLAARAVGARQPPTTRARDTRRAGHGGCGAAGLRHPRGTPRGGCLHLSAARKGVSCLEFEGDGAGRLSRAAAPWGPGPSGPSPPSEPRFPLSFRRKHLPSPSASHHDAGSSSGPRVLPGGPNVSVPRERPQSTVLNPEPLGRAGPPPPGRREVQSPREGSLSLH